MVKMNKDEQPICEISSTGNKWWYLNNQYHREDGPAVEYSDGSTLWYHYGQLHRLDGPAEDYANGNKYWWYQGKQINCSSQEEFNRLIKLKALW